MAEFNLSRGLAGAAGGLADFVKFNADTARAEALTKLRQKGQRELQREGISLRAGEANRAREFQAEQAGLAREADVEDFERQADLQRELTGVKEGGRASRAAAQQAAIESRFVRGQAGDDRRAAMSAGQSAFQEAADKEDAKSTLKELASFRQAGKQATSTLARLDRAEQLNEEPGQTGVGATAITGIKSFLGTLGIPTKAVEGVLGSFGKTATAGEVLSSIQTDLALEQIARTKGQVSNAEWKAFIQSVAGAGNNQAANRILIEFSRAVANREKLLAQMANEHVRGEKGQVARRFDPSWDQKVESLGSVYTPELEQFIDDQLQIGSGGAPRPAEQAVVPPGARWNPRDTATRKRGWYTFEDGRAVFQHANNPPQ